MLNGWDPFFIMTGTAGATLTGLLFVVITLCVRLSTTRAAQGVHAFVTPTLGISAACCFRAWHWWFHGPRRGHSPLSSACLGSGALPM